MRGLVVFAVVAAALFLMVGDTVVEKQQESAVESTVKPIYRSSQVVVTKQKTPSVMIWTEPSWCEPCQQLERDNVAVDLAINGWDVVIRGGESGVVPRYEVTIGGYKERHSGYRGRPLFYGWLRSAIKNSRR